MLQCEANQKPAKTAIPLERKIPGFASATKSRHVAEEPCDVDVNDIVAESPPE
jgi:hypothetical protein